jgi:hypothetical protein
LSRNDLKAGRASQNDEGNHIDPTLSNPAGHSDHLRPMYEAAREQDRRRYHGGPDGSQAPEAGPIGLEHNGEVYCVGCLWCDGDFDHWASYQTRGK